MLSVLVGVTHNTNNNFFAIEKECKQQRQQKWLTQSGVGEAVPRREVRRIGHAIRVATPRRHARVVSQRSHGSASSRYRPGLTGSHVGQSVCRAHLVTTRGLLLFWWCWSVKLSLYRTALQDRRGAGFFAARDARVTRGGCASRLVRVRL
jgi:hypothetical protein